MQGPVEFYSDLVEEAISREFKLMIGYKWSVPFPTIREGTLELRGREQKKEE